MQPDAQEDARVSCLRRLGDGSKSSWTSYEAPAETVCLCIDNTAYHLRILGKVYRILPDAKPARDDLVRIVDEGGED